MIEVDDLRKSFWVAKHHRGVAGALRNLVTRAGREVRAVDRISFRVAAGEMVGYIGPNSAGKSDDQDADRHPRPDERPDRRRGPDADPTATGVGRADRRRLRPADAAWWICR